MAVEKDASDKTVENARKQKRHQIKHYNVGEEIALDRRKKKKYWQKSQTNKSFSLKNTISPGIPDGRVS